MATREVRITGSRDAIRQALQQMVDEVDESETDDIEVELIVAANAQGDPSLLLNFNSSDTEDDDPLLVEYAESDEDGD